MRILLLADINSIHTQRWAAALRDRGVGVSVFSLNPLKGQPTENRVPVSHVGPETAKGSVESSDLPDNLQDIGIYNAGQIGDDLSYMSLIRKARYFMVVSTVKKLIRTLKPDIVHAHYVSSYGTLGAFSGFHPLVLSVWGSDIYDFPKSSFLTRLLIGYNLIKADRILSTSFIMADETRKYTRKEVGITPFGIDIRRFRRNRDDADSQAASILPPGHHDSDRNSAENMTDGGKPLLSGNRIHSGTFVIGTVKALEATYGIETLIDSFNKFSQGHPYDDLHLLIVGGGPLEASLKQRVSNLGIDDRVTFTGKISHEKVPVYLNMMDVFAALSVSESFGVSVVEAMACEVPVVVSAVGGLTEVIADGITGFAVPQGDVGEAAIAFDRLFMDPGKRREMGLKSRARVEELYNWDRNVEQMMGIYRDVMKKE